VARNQLDTLADSSGGFDDTLTGALPDALFAGRFEIERLLRGPRGRERVW
jgi:hypothetical protein